MKWTMHPDARRTSDKGYVINRRGPGDYSVERSPGVPVPGWNRHNLLSDAKQQAESDYQELQRALQQEQEQQ